MKKQIISYLLFLSFIFMFPHKAFSEFCYERVYLNIVGNGSCPTTEPVESPTSVPTNCNVSELVEWGNCVELWRICCDMSVNSYDIANVTLNTITQVPFGEEGQAADTFFRDFQEYAPVPECQETFSPAGSMSGYVYETSINSNSTADVKMSIWNRVLCSKNGQGNINPIGYTGGGGSGGGGLDETQTANAVKAGVDGSDVLGDMLGKLSSIDSKTGTGGGGGGLTQSQMTDAVSDALNPGEVGNPSYTPLDEYSDNEIPDKSFFDLSERFSEFMTSIRSTSLFSNFSLTPMGNVGGGSSTISFNLGTFGNGSIDFSDYSSALSVLKGFILLIGSYLAVRIIVMKR